MEIIISLLMGTRLLALFGGGLGSESAPVFLEPRIIIAGDEIRLTCSLANAFPAELRKLVQSATPVVMYTIVTVSEGEKKHVVKKVTVENRLVYDMIAGRFSVTRSAARDTLIFSEIDSALNAAARFPDIPVIIKKEIRRESSYIFTAQAIVGKARVEALDNKEIDCMYYWNYKRPTLRTSEIKGEELLKGGKER